MKNLVLIMGVAIIVFSIYRLILVLIGAFIMKVFKVNSKNYDRVDIWVSASLYLIFTAGLISTIDVINKSADGTTNWTCVNNVDTNSLTFDYAQAA